MQSICFSPQCISSMLLKCGEYPNLVHFRKASKGLPHTTTFFMRRAALRHDTSGCNFYFLLCFILDDKIGLLIARYSSGMIVRYRICHKISYYRSLVFTHRDERTAPHEKTQPCGAALREPMSKVDLRNVTFLALVALTCKCISKNRT